MRLLGAGVNRAVPSVEGLQSMMNRGLIWVVVGLLAITAALLAWPPIRDWREARIRASPEYRAALIVCESLPMRRKSCEAAVAREFGVD